MDKQEFKQKIIEVAEIEELKPVKVANIRLDETDQNEVRVGDEWVHLDEKVNPTLGFKFIKLKEQHRMCEMGCGLVIANQVIERRLAFTPEKHWRTRCQQCGKYEGPPGHEGLVAGGHLVASIFLRYFKRKK